MPNNHDQVTEKNLDFVVCPNDACHYRGSYVYCYFDTYLNCESYYKYMEALVRGQLHEGDGLDEDF